MLVKFEQNRIVEKLNFLSFLTKMVNHFLDIVDAILEDAYVT